MAKITGVLVNPDAKTCRKVTLEHSLESFYEALDCTTIDIVNRKIGEKRFLIVCDDEGTFKDDPFISALDRLYRPMLVGRLFVVQHDGKEDIGSLTDEEAAYVLRHTRKLRTQHHAEPYPMLYPVEY